MRFCYTFIVRARARVRAHAHMHMKRRDWTVANTHVGWISNCYRYTNKGPSVWDERQQIGSSEHVHRNDVNFIPQLL